MAPLQRICSHYIFSDFFNFLLFKWITLQWVCLCLTALVFVITIVASWMQPMLANKNKKKNMAFLLGHFCSLLSLADDVATLCWSCVILFVKFFRCCCCCCGFCHWCVIVNVVVFFVSLDFSLCYCLVFSSTVFWCVS